MGYDENELDVCKDETPVEVKRRRSIILSVIGIILMLMDFIAMPILDSRHALHNNEDMVYFVHAMLLEGGVVASTALMILAFIFNRKHIPLYILIVLWLIACLDAFNLLPW